MSTLASTIAGPGDARRWVVGTRTWLVLAIAAATFLIRAPNFGDPNYHIDESFYLMVGQKMQLGAIPYVDIWDRKPLGLFLIYWLIAGLGGSGVPQYHAVATLFAFLTAVMIALIVLRLHRPIAAAFTAIVYLATLEPLAGGGGQSPIFYNLFVAGAVLLTMNAWAAERIEAFRLPALGAMALCGLAIFVKQAAVVESAFLGLALLAAAWRLDPAPARLVARALTYMAIGIAPTALALAAYAAIGHAGDFWFANVTSIFLKRGPSAAARIDMALHLLVRVMPLLLMSIGGCVLLARHPARHAAWLVIGWLAAAFGGFLAVPNFYDHYALPVIAPMAVASAILFARPGTGPIYAMFAIIWPLFWASWPALDRTRESRTDFAAATAVIERYRGNSLLYIYDAAPLLYTATGSPLPTSRAFPEHINNADEGDATGIDATREFRRIMALKPRVIVKGVRSVVRRPNFIVREELQRELSAHYRRVAIVPLREYAFARPTEFWVRVD